MPTLSTPIHDRTSAPAAAEIARWQEPRRLALACREPRRLVSVLGVELAVHDSAPGSLKPMVVCLHAMGHGGSDFAAFEDALADRYRIVTVDWPGQGASGTDAQPASTQRYTELFAALVELLQWKSLTLLGNSIGGAVAIRYAAAHPENVRAVMFSNSGGLDKNPGGCLPALFTGHIARKMALGARREPAFERWFRAYYADVLITPAARAQRDAIVRSGYETASVLAQAWASFGRADADVRALAAGLKVPVFVGWADRDKLVRWSRNRQAIERIPNVEIHHFEAGHSPFLETPREFNCAAAAFLRKHGG